MKYSTNKSHKNADCSNSEFADRLVELFPRLADCVIASERNYLSRGLISVPHVRALQVLSNGQSCSMGTLAKALRLKAPTVTGLVDRLIRLGLARRSNSDEDRRAVLVAITPRGARILSHLYEEKRKSAAMFSRNITGRERIIFLDIIEKIVNSLAKQE